MANRERARDHGTRIASAQLQRLAHEAREARIRSGRSQRVVAASIRIDRSWISRFERGKAQGIAVDTLARILAVVGLDLSMRAYPADDDGLRDEGQARLIARLIDLLPARVGRALEVPFPALGDRRAWDVRLRIGPQAWGIEAETHVRDLQATVRSLKLKARDGEVDGVILLVLDSRHHRALLRRHASLLRADFPVDGQAALADLAAGRTPAGNAIILL